MKRKLLLPLLLILFINCFGQIPLRKMGGNLYEIKAEINNVVKLPFIFDTGASEMSIPPSVARILILSGTLTAKDTLRGSYYTFANGHVLYQRRFRIRKLKIGNIILRDVTCSVGNSEATSLLFGQSALKKFKSYRIDNNKNLLIIHR